MAKINWFRNADFDAPKNTTPSVVKPSMPKPPKSIKPKKPKQVFHGPKNPGAYKRKLYVPHKFVQAAPAGMMTDEEMQALMPPLSIEPEVEPVEEIEEELVPSPLTPTNYSDPVTNGIATIPNIAKITWISANERGCDWCRALNGRTWYSVEDFSQDKNNIIKPGVDNIHLAHPHCTCTVKVETTDGQVFHVDSAGIPG